VELLRRIQTICVEQSPIDYEDYEGDVKANGVISHMLAGEIGGPTLPRYQPTRFKVSNIRSPGFYEIFFLVPFLVLYS
jgi:hypothetical protein